jgi:asparagine synthase (glutamine-hydrolysing)
VSQHDGQPTRGLVGGMLACIAHRGPDDFGEFESGPLAMGMRRLSILDPTAAGHQPMTSSDGRYTIVHNGEIYNFLELADELESDGIRFVTRTDTEVILSAYAAWGPACVERFNGIWAFAIWDNVEQTLFLSRDRVGVKPLFLARRGGDVAFGSEIKALRRVPWVSDEVRPDVVRRYLIDGKHDRGTATFFKDIEAFPAAHWMLLTRDDTRTHRYWTPTMLSTDSSIQPQRHDADLVDAFRSLFIDAVALQLRSDVPLGSCLSGGLDSSSIVCTAAGLRRGDIAAASGAHHRERTANPQLAFFAEFREEGIDERPYVDAVVDATGVILHTTTPDTTAFLESLHGVLAAQDEPFGSLSILAQYHVMRIARETGVKVLLDGQGADELLAGYANYRGIRMAGALRSRNLRAIAEAGVDVITGRAPRRSTLGHALIGTRPLPARLIRGAMPLAWLGGLTRDAVESEGRDRGSGTLLASKLWDDVATDNLPMLLRYEDRNSMAFGIEARVPFLDHRLIEASLALPDRLKIDRRGRQKAVLRRAMKGIVPDVVLNRRDKVAFQPPQDRWLRSSEQTWRNVSIRSCAEQSGMLAKGTVAAAIDAHLAGSKSSDVLWRILNLELWLRGPNEGLDA